MKTKKGTLAILVISLLTTIACTGTSSSTTEATDLPLEENASSSSNAVSNSDISISENVTWNKAVLTWYISWPDPNSEECIEYNGCTWAGYFAGVEGQKSEEWVREHNIIAVHEKDWETYKLKTFRLRQNGNYIDAVVYDMCSDNDCDGCCTRNAGTTGFLIDIESYTRARFNNQGAGIVEWICLDCE